MKRKPYSKMSARELARATREYERSIAPEADGLPGRRLTTSEAAQWKRAQAKMGRPRIGKGVKRVMVSLEAELLRKTDRYAHEHGLSRSKLISEGLRKVLAS